MRRHFGRTLVLVFVALTAMAAAVLRTEWAGERACASARARLPELLGMEVSLSSCRIDPVSGGVEIRGFSATPRGATEPLFAADRLLAQLRVLELLTGRIRLERVEAERPRIRADLSRLELGGAASTEGCWLNEMARIEVDTLAVNGAEVHLVGPGGRTLDLDEVDLDLRLGRHAYSVRLSVPRGKVATGRVEVPLSRMRFSSTLDLDRQRLTLNHLEVAAGELALFAQGDVESLCEPSLALEASLRLPLDLVSAILGPQAPAMSGTALVNLNRVEGTLSDPRLELEVTLARAEVAGLDVGDAFLEARVEDGEAKIDKLDLAVGEGRVQVAGKLGLSKSFPFAAGADLENLPFARLLDKLGLDHAWVDFRGSGRVDVTGELLPFHLSGPASVDVKDFHVYSGGWDLPDPFHVLDLEQAHVELVLDVNTERVRLLKGRVRTPRGSNVEADVTLNFDPQKGFLIDAIPDEVDLADLQHVIGLSVDGKVKGRCSIKVIDGVPRIDGQATIREFRFFKMPLGTTEARIVLRGSRLGFHEVVAAKGLSRFHADGTFDLGGHEPRVKATGSFEGARLADLVDILGDVHWVFEPLRGRSDARLTGSASIEGPVLAARARVETRIEDMVWLDRHLGSGRLVFRAEDGQRILLEPIELEGPCGKLHFAGKVDFEQGIDLELDAPLLVAEELAKPGGEHLGARGTLSANIRFFGPTEHARAEGTVVAQNLAAFGVGLGGGTLDLKMDRTTVSLRGPVGTDLLLDGRLVFEGEMPFAMGVSAHTTDLGHYFPDVEGLTGALSGELLATGAITRYWETRGDIWIPKVSAAKGEWRLTNEGAVALSFRGGLVELKSAIVKGPAGMRLSAFGVLDGDLDVSLDGSFDAKLFELLLPWVDQAAGKVQLSATVSGPPSRPEVVGAASFESGRFTVRGWPAAVGARDVRGKLEFSQKRLFLSDVEGTVNGGQVQARGDIELKDFVPHRFDLSMQLDEVQVRYPETVPSTFSGELKFVGPLSNAVLAGKIDLVRLRYAEEFDLDAILSNARHRRVDAKSFEKREEWLRYDLDVSVKGGGGARIDNNFLKLSLAGDLKVVGTNVHTGLQGTLEAEEGGRGYFRGNEFWISSGAVNFTEREKIAASVDVHAEAQVRDYKVHLRASGPVEDPEVTLTSEPELNPSDVFALLTLGVTSRDQGAYTGAAGAGLMGETLMNIAGLDKQFKKFVPKNTILRDFNVHISTQYSDMSGMVEPTAQLESKFITDSLKLRLSQPVISGKGRRAQAEYRFNEHMSAQAQWDNESSESSLGDLGLDLKLRWEFE
ncbi:MAG: translocation/assembly module TamB domain-containing protein [Deltaproteobacteria bacterium]|nr:translocation/assembly module TamB domain-containing protein [Deltaproteobacteria bacterium]